MTPCVFARTYASQDPAALFAQVRTDGFKAEADAPAVAAYLSTLIDSATR